MAATPNDNAESRRALLSLSTTCKSLSNAALNQIWYRLPSLVPLLYTMPSDLWTSTILDQSPNDNDDYSSDEEDEEDNISINALRATDFETGF